MSAFPLLACFRATLPRYEITQTRSLEWLAEVHAEAEGTLHELDAPERRQFAELIATILKRCACSPDKIARRAMVIPDCTTDRWNERILYNLVDQPHGKGSAARTRVFGDFVSKYFELTYAAESEAPDDLIHVTCTGYISPSGAQRLVARRAWDTRVTHAYHMGCYAAMPAIRIAAGALATQSRRIDIVHTELCSLHLDPSDHRIEQLVVQSLFADGLIRYSMIPDDGRPGLRLLALHEQVLPDSADSMSWMVADWGMQMGLARDVPDRIAGALRGFTSELIRRAGLDLGRLRDAVFAVHPGGPKIIDQVRDVLELDDAQVAASREVLFARGNMSSATLPHIWMGLIDDPEVPAGTLIPSLAFGPGLTMCGAVFEKQ